MFRTLYVMVFSVVVVTFSRCFRLRFDATFCRRSRKPVRLYYYIPTKVQPRDTLHRVAPFIPPCTAPRLARLAQGRENVYPDRCAYLTTLDKGRPVPPPVQSRACCHLAQAGGAPTCTKPSKCLVKTCKTFSLPRSARSKMATHNAHLLMGKLCVDTGTTRVLRGVGAENRPG